MDVLRVVEKKEGKVDLISTEYLTPIHHGRIFIPG